MQTDLLGNPHISIKDNQVLEAACNRILAMAKENPELLNGDTMRQVDRQLYAEILWRDCFATLISPERKQVFINTMLKAPEADIYTRARRELLSRDLIRVSAKAIRDAEQFRARISSAMR